MIAALRRHYEVIALVLLLGLGAVIAQVAAARDAAERGGTALSSRAAQPTGALALALWLDRLGYQVTQLEGSRSTPDDRIRYLFVLRPIRRFSQSDASAVVDWIRRGGTLLYVPGFLPEIAATGLDSGDGLDRELGVGLRLAPGASATNARPGAPVTPFFAPSTGAQFQVVGVWQLQLEDPAWVPLVDAGPTSARQVIAAERHFGAGRAYAVATESFFDNAHLSDAGNAAFVLNALARGAPERTVAFDEYHHGEAVAPDLASALRVSPIGWAIAYGAIATFIFALWSGRRFGPPVPRISLPGRTAADYVTAFAGLLQRAPGARGAAVAWAQEQYVRLVRRGLGRAHGLRSDLPAGDLAALLADRRPIAAEELADRLIVLDGPPIGEKRLLDEMRRLEPILRVLAPPESEGR